MIAYIVDSFINPAALINKTERAHCAFKKIKGANINLLHQERDWRKKLFNKTREMKKTLLGINVDC